MTTYLNLKGSSSSENGRCPSGRALQRTLAGPECTERSNGVCNMDKWHGQTLKHIIKYYYQIDFEKFNLSKFKLSYGSTCDHNGRCLTHPGSSNCVATLLPSMRPPFHSRWSGCSRSSATLLSVHGRFTFQACQGNSDIHCEFNQLIVSLGWYHAARVILQSWLSLFTAIIILISIFFWVCGLYG